MFNLTNFSESKYMFDRSRPFTIVVNLYQFSQVDAENCNTKENKKAN